MKSVLRCKKAIEKFNKKEICKLLLSKWDIVEEMIRVLRVPHVTTLCLQRQNCTLSDFFGFMIGIDISLQKEIASKKNKTKLPELLIAKINDRKEKLLENRLMITAIYLDPRYNCALKKYPEKITMAKLTLEKLWERRQDIRKLDDTDNNQSMNTLEISNNSITSNSSLNMDAILSNVDMYYEANGFTTSDEQPTTSNTGSLNDLIIEFERFEEMTMNKRINSKNSVLQFWEDNKYAFKELYELAIIINGIPPTQSSIERLFSALNFIFSDRRARLKQKMLEDILLIYSNKDYFYAINEEELVALQNSLKEKI